MQQVYYSLPRVSLGLPLTPDGISLADMPLRQEILKHLKIFMLETKELLWNSTAPQTVFPRIFPVSY
jgi:hypothetical protein